MAIAVTCPHCGKTYHLKDHLQGKRVACIEPTCKKVFLVQSRPPANGAIPAANVDDLAFAALADDDKPSAKVPESTTIIRVVCQFCDHANEFDAAMAGKNAPCQNEECRKIIRIPLPKKEDPKDWRTVQRRPTAAKIESAGFEGAWGNVETTAVSREAILEAGANVVDEREPRSWMQVISLAALALSIVTLVVIGGWWTWKRRSQGRQEHAMEMAFSLVKSQADRPSSVKKNHAGGIRMLAGVYEVGKGNALAAKLLYNEARRDLDQTSDSAEAAVALIELARLQCELAGPTGSGDAANRLDWDRDKLAGEVRATLNRWPAGNGPIFADMRAFAAHRLTHALVAGGHGPMAGPFLISITPREDQAEILGVVGLELLDRGHRDEAQRVAMQASNLPKENASSLIALWLALDVNEGPAKAGEIAPPPGAGGSISPVGQVGYSEGFARSGKMAEARRWALSGLPEHQLRAGFGLIRAALATSSVDPQDLDRCAQLVEKDLKDRTDLDWLLLSFVEAALEAKKPDQARRFAQAISSTGLRAWAKYLVLSAQARQGRSITEEMVKEVGPPESLAHGLAWAEYARAKVLIEGVGKVLKEVKGWSSDTQKAFGLAGVSLAQN